MKFWSVIESVEATSAPTLTDAPGAKNTPALLTRKTWPLAVRRPKMLEGSLPTTRLRRDAEEFGWVMLTCSLEPIEKPCQLTMPFCVAWLICIVSAVGRVTCTVPCTTFSPVGRE
jgi:hypothetical protein